MRAMLALAAFVIGAACGPGFAEQQGARNWDSERSRMVGDQLRARDITDTRVLDAMRKVPRHLFVPEPQRTQAYGDHPLPIGHDQTISQPYIVAFMTQGLKVDASHRVLEIGTGSGYQAAILGLLAKEVYTIEIIEPLATRAGATLAGQGHRERPRAPRQRLSGLAGACAVRPNHGHGSARRSAAGARRAAEGRRPDGDPRWDVLPGAAHHAPHGHRPRNTPDAPGPVRAHDRQAEAGSGAMSRPVMFCITRRRLKAVVAYGSAKACKPLASCTTMYCLPWCM